MAVSELPGTAPRAKNGKHQFTPEIEAKILDACGSGFTIEKAGALVGVNPSTIRTWCQRKPKFAEKVETARKNHELSLLKSIEQAGEKSWQAKAWMAERVYNYAQPSARLQVSGDVQHTATGGFAQLLAGLASRRAEKKAQVIECKEVRAIENPGKYNVITNGKDTMCCATNDSHQQLTEAKCGLGRKRRIKTRKPRAESLEKWPIPRHPPATPPATDSTRNTPLNNCDTKQKEDHAQETSQGSAEGS